MLALSNVKIQTILNKMKAEYSNIFGKASIDMQLGNCVDKDKLVLFDMYLWALSNTSEDNGCIEDYTCILKNIGRHFNININLAQ